MSEKYCNFARSLRAERKTKIYGRYRENQSNRNSFCGYELTAMYWHIGDRINRDVLNNERAEYGQQIVSQVATQLQEEYETKSFELRNIQRMMQFARLLPDFQIVSTLLSKLSWSHFVISTER